MQNSSLGIHYEIVLRSMLENIINEKSILVQIMAWCRQAPSHYLNQCWARSMLPYGVTRPQWVNFPCYLPNFSNLASMFVWQFVCLSVGPSVCLSLSLSVCLFVCGSEMLTILVAPFEQSTPNLAHICILDLATCVKFLMLMTSLMMLSGPKISQIFKLP